MAKTALEAAAYLQSSLITDQQQAAPSLISNRFSMLGSYRAAVIDILSLLSAVVHYMSLGMNYILDCVYHKSTLSEQALECHWIVFQSNFQ